jgi:hypothetical protein
MTDLELGWVAGLMEGEGCFYSKRTKSLVTRIIVGSTDKDVLDKLASICGGKVGGPYLADKRVKPFWNWNIWGRKAYELMKLVRPLMGSRRQNKIDAVVEAYEASLLTRHGDKRRTPLLSGDPSRLWSN